MKNKRIIGLSLAAMMFGGVLAFGNVAEANTKNVGSVKVEKVFSEDSKVDAKQTETDLEFVLNDAEASFFKDGLNKSEDKSIFYAEVLAHGDKVEDKTAKKGLFKGNDMAIYFSPTLLKEKHPAFGHGFKNVTFEVVDKKGHVCRFTVTDVFSQPCGDVALVYVPDKADAKLVNNREERIFDYSKISLDEGFGVALNEEFIIRVYDSAGKLVVEDSCVSAAESDDEFMVSGLIAHPKKFDKGFYREVLSKFRAGMQNKLDKVTNTVLNAFVSSKKNKEKVIEFGEVQSGGDSVEAEVEVEDDEDNLDN